MSRGPRQPSWDTWASLTSRNSKESYSREDRGIEMRSVLFRGEEESKEIGKLLCKVTELGKNESGVLNPEYVSVVCFGFFDHEACGILATC